MGTATYFSPEQARGEPVDPRSDVYSLGVVLYEMLTGRPPFAGDNPVAVAYKHVQETPVPPRQVNPALPSALEAVTLKALAKNIANRYPSADDLAADLRRFREGREVLAEPLLAPPSDLTTAVRRQPPADATRAVPAAGPATSVTTAVPAGYGEEPPRRSSALFIVVLVVLLGLLALLLFLLGRTIGLGDDDTAAQVAVPDVVNRTQPEAVALLEASGFTVKTEQGENADVAEGTVFDQDPAAGEKIDEGSEVTIVVSSTRAPVEVPNLVGQQGADAEAQLVALGLDADFDRVDDPEVPAGTVIAQDPAAGEELPPGSTVRLEVSNGPGSAEVPDVTGRTPEEAANVLGRAGFETTFAEERSDDVEEGTVARTDPPAGTDLAKGETVTVYVSSGSASVTVPNVVGMTEAEAVATLQDAGFRVMRVSQTVASPANDGKVIDQSPEPGDQAESGATVTITVGQAIGSSTTSTTDGTTTTSTTADPDEE
jgi:serine/threonine-protein kinase